MAGSKMVLYQVESSDLSELEINDGQFICTSDIPGCFYDAGTVRYGLATKNKRLYIATAPTTGDNPYENLDVNNESISISSHVASYLNTEYSALEFVFYDKGTYTQFSTKVYGVPNDEYHTNYSFGGCTNICANNTLCNTLTINNGNIYKETVYVRYTLNYDGTITPVNKIASTETIINNIHTVEDSDISSSNRVGLVAVIGWR